MKYIFFSLCLFSLIACGESHKDKISQDSPSSDTPAQENSKFSAKEESLLKTGYRSLLESGTWHEDCVFVLPRGHFEDEGFWAKTEWIFRKNDFIKAFDSFDNKEACEEARLIQLYDYYNAESERLDKARKDIGEEIELTIERAKQVTLELRTINDRRNELAAWIGELEALDLETDGLGQPKLSGKQREELNKLRAELELHFEQSAPLVSSFATELETLKEKEQELEQDDNKLIKEIKDLNDIDLPFIESGTYAFVGKAVAATNEGGSHMSRVLQGLRLRYKYTRTGKDGEQEVKLETVPFIIGSDKSGEQIYLDEHYENDFKTLEYSRASYAEPLRRYED